MSSFDCGSYLVPAFQGPFPLLQHKTLVLVRPLDVALTDFQPLNDFPAVCLLERNKKYSVVSERIHSPLQIKKKTGDTLAMKRKDV